MPKPYDRAYLAEEGTEDYVGWDLQVVESFGLLGTREPSNVLSKGLALPPLHFKLFRCLKSVGEEGKEK